MKMKKKITAVTLALSICMGLTACGSDQKEDSTSSQSTSQSSSQSGTETPASGENYTPKYANAAASAGDIERPNLQYVSETPGNQREAETVYAGDFSEMTSASMKLFHICLEMEEKGKNVLLSPFSIQEALGMTAQGAGGTTRQEMEAVIGGKLKMEQISPALSYLTSQMQGSEEVSWNVANSIWINEEKESLQKLNQTYLEEAGTYYAPEIYYVPYNDATAEEINNWVNYETKGMIPVILDKAPDGAMNLINAVAFEGEWEETYAESAITENADFTNADGTVSKVNMLRSTEDYYFELAGGKGFVKYYSGGQYAFAGILPPEGMTPEDYIKKISESGESFTQAFLNKKHATVYAAMPEFKTEYSNEISDELQAAGMEMPFMAGADFSGFSKDNSLYISLVNHKTFIDVNRKGTRAAAVTQVEMKDEAVFEEEETVEVTLDRPFVYAIVDTTTGTPVFLGVQNTME